MKQETGELIWKYAIYKENNIIFNTLLHFFINLNLNLRYNCNYQMYSTPFVFRIKNNKFAVVCATCDGQILILSLLGSLVFIYKLDGEIFSSPIVFNSKLFIGCRDNFLYALNMSEE